MLNQKTKKPWESKEQKTILGKSRGKGGSSQESLIFFVFCLSNVFFLTLFCFYCKLFCVFCGFDCICEKLSTNTENQSPGPMATPSAFKLSTHTYIYIYIGSVS